MSGKRSLEEMVRRGETEIFRDNSGAMHDIRDVSIEDLEARIQSLANEEEAIHEEKIRYAMVLYRRKHESKETDA